MQYEVLKSRLLREYNIKIKYGELKIPYRESILSSIKKKLTYEQHHNGKTIYAELEVIVKSLGNVDEEHNEYSFNILKTGYKKTVEVDPSSPKYIGVNASKELIRSLESMPEEYKKAIEEAVNNSLLAGKVLGYKMIGVSVEIIGGKWSNVRSNESAFRLCASELLSQSLNQASPCLLEPYMELTLTVPDFCVKEIMTDIIVNRGGEVIIPEETELSKNVGSLKKKLTAILPLSEVNNYGSYIRAITKGHGSYTEEFCEYRPLSKEKTRKLLENCST